MICVVFTMVAILREGPEEEKSVKKKEGNEERNFAFLGEGGKGGGENLLF